MDINKGQTRNYNFEKLPTDQYLNGFDVVIDN